MAEVIDNDKIKADLKETVDAYTHQKDELVKLKEELKKNKKKWSDDDKETRKKEIKK